MEEIVVKAIEAMRRRGFDVHAVQDAQQARELVLSMIPAGASVGVGGSMTIRELALIPELEARGSKVWWHWLNPAERDMIYENARKADFYLASSNAVTRDGSLVNIDGQANRVAAMIQGPKHVILVIGSQKVVDGGVNADTLESVARTGVDIAVAGTAVFGGDIESNLKKLRGVIADAS